MFHDVVQLRTALVVTPGTAAEPGEPMALLGVGPFHPVGLVFALVEPPNRDQAGVDLINVGTGQPGASRLKPADQVSGVSRS